MSSDAGSDRNSNSAGAFSAFLGTLNASLHDDGCASTLVLRTGNVVARCGQIAGHTRLHSANVELLDDSTGLPVGVYVEWENR